MTAGALGEERPTLFLRKATGLVRGWSVRDSLIYACLSTNVVTLGMVEWTYASPAFPQGQLITLDHHLGNLGLVPGHRLHRAGRHDPAGGRRLRLAEPHPGQRDRLRDGRHRLVVHPVAVGADLRQSGLSRSSSSRSGPRSGPGQARRPGSRTHNGVFVVTLITIALAGVLVSIGMAGYAQVQKWCFIGGLIGFAIIVILLLINSARRLHHRVQPGRAARCSASRTPTRPPTRAAVKAGYTHLAARLRPARADHAARARR